MKKSVVALLLLAGLVAMLAGAGIGQAACGQAGSSPADHRGSCETSGNDLSCGPGGNATPAGKVYADANGVDACSDSGTLQGRAGVRIDGTNSFVYTDGDKDTLGSTGWHKISMSGCTQNADPTRPSYNQAGKPC